MTHEEFVRWLDDEVGAERMTRSERNDLLDQKSVFDDERSSFIDDPKFNRLIVGYVAGKRIVANRIHPLIERAQEQFPNRMIYFEPIGFDLL